MTLCGETSGARMRTRIPGVSDCGSGTSPSAANTDAEAKESKTSATHRLTISPGNFLLGIGYSRFFESHRASQRSAPQNSRFLSVRARIRILINMNQTPAAKRIMLGHRRSVRRRTIELNPAGTVILQLEPRADQAAQRALETDLRWGTETNCAGTEVTEVWFASGQHRDDKKCREQPMRAAQLAKIGRA